jgi:uncharacterized membrane protein YqhA
MKKIQWVLFSLPFFVQNALAQVGSDFDGIIPSRNTSDKAILDLADRVETGTLHVTDILYFIVKLIDLVSGLAGTLCVLMLLYGGFQYMISGLNDDKESAKKTIRYAITGLVVSFLAYLIVNILFVQFTGMELTWDTMWAPNKN